jgi:hypothetical protein
LSHKYGSHWQNNDTLFNTKSYKDQTVFDCFQNHINEQLKPANRRNVEFIDHYLKQYNDPPAPPSWMSIELLYISDLSKICESLASGVDALIIIRNFALVKPDAFKKPQ